MCKAQVIWYLIFVHQCNGVGADQSHVFLFYLIFFSYIYFCNVSLQCGRPVEVKVCPECKVKIGGTGYHLSTGNTVAQRYATITCIYWTFGSDMFIIRAEQEVVIHVGHVLKYVGLGLTPKPKK